jgi:hypothetical protein
MVFLDDFPTPSLCNPAQFAKLVFDGLFVCRHADVNPSPFVHDKTRCHLRPGVHRQADH